jgi:hypothetical protein
MDRKDTDEEEYECLTEVFMYRIELGYLFLGEVKLPRDPAKVSP